MFLSNLEGIKRNFMYVFPTNLATFGKIKVASMTVRLKVVNSSQLSSEEKEKFCANERKKINLNLIKSN